MKRRIQGLVSSTGAATKKRSWKEDDAVTSRGRQPAKDSDDEEEEDDDEPSPPPPLPAARKPEPPSAPAESDDEEAWMALEEAAGDLEEPVPKGLNPVVWMDISVASKPRGRVFFELFRDVVPRTAENFRKLCVGVPEDPKRPEGPRYGYKASELYKVIAGRTAEGGEFDRSASGKEFKDESFRLKHSKGGLLTMANDGPHTNTSRFQVTFKPLPALDNKQVVFGQAVADPAQENSERLNPLHWAGAMGTTSGTPLEAVVIEDCGECSGAEAQRLLGPPRPGDAPESQSARYSRANLHVGKLEEAISRESVVDMLELTEAVLESLEWQAKKAERSAENRKASEVEAGCKALKAVLEEIEFKAGDVQGSDGKQSRKAKTQIFRVRDVEEMLGKIY